MYTNIEIKIDYKREHVIFWLMKSNLKEQLYYLKRPDYQTDGMRHTHSTR